MHMAECAPEVIARGSVPTPLQVQSSPPHQQVSLKQGTPPDGNYDHDMSFGSFQQPSQQNESRPSWDTREWGQQRGRDGWGGQAPPQQPPRGPVYGHSSSRPATNQAPPALPPPPQLQQHHQSSAGRNNLYNQDNANQYGHSQHNMLRYLENGDDDNDNFNRNGRENLLDFYHQPSIRSTIQTNNHSSLIHSPHPHQPIPFPLQPPPQLARSNQQGLYSRGSKDYVQHMSSNMDFDYEQFENTYHRGNVHF